MTRIRALPRTGQQAFAGRGLPLTTAEKWYRFPAICF